LLRFWGTFHFCQKEMGGRDGGENIAFAGIFAEFVAHGSGLRWLDGGYPQKSHNLHLHAQVSHF
jgi:hypothetical protein